MRCVLGIKPRRPEGLEVKIMNIPNFLSLFRLVLVPCFAVIYMSSLKSASLFAGMIFVLAAITDAADGYIARKYNKITKIGRILDPLADKLLQLTAISCLTLKSIVPAAFFAIFVIKELLMILGGMFMVNRMNDVMPSNLYGKVLTFLVSASIATAIFFFKEIEKAVPGLFRAVFGVLSVFAVVVLVVYGVKYILYITHRRELDTGGTHRSDEK